MLAFNHLGKLGQLGNQMFQYAALRGIAANKNYEWCIPNHNEVVVDSLGNKLRIELFDCFELYGLNSNNISVLDQGHAPLVIEKQFHFDEDLYNFCSNEVSLYGFFQSEKWFSAIKEQIREDFTFRENILAPCKQIMGSIESPLSIHIRRGDFLINSVNHHNLGIDYYEEALSHFDSNLQVIVFSDDPEWCSSQDLFVGDRFLISENNSSYIDMCLMSLCKYHIIANSTFSWWGAWLSNSEKVIAPSKWFGPNNASKNTKDLYPDKWIVI